MTLRNVETGMVREVDTISMMSPTELLDLGLTDPKTKKAMEKIPAFEDFLDMDNPDETIPQMREIMASLPVQPPNPAVSERDVHYTNRNGDNLRIRIYDTVHPVAGFESSPHKPMFVLFHWGGFCVGTPEGMAPIARACAMRLGVVVATPEYRLGPEHKFPASLDDAYNSVKWIAANMASLGADASKGFVVGGQSAGATAAVLAAYQARDDKIQPPITGIYFSAGTCLPPERVPEKYKDRYLSRTQRECEESRSLFNTKWKRMFEKARGDDPDSVLLSPFTWPTGHQGMPPFYVQVCGQDIFRDEELLYEEMLREDEGISTRLDVYPGQPHGFWNMYKDLDMSKKCNDDTIAGVGWLLGREPLPISESPVEKKDEVKSEVLEFD